MVSGNCDGVYFPHPRDDTDEENDKTGDADTNHATGRRDIAILGKEFGASHSGKWEVGEREKREEEEKE